MTQTVMNPITYTEPEIYWPLYVTSPYDYQTDPTPLYEEFWFVRGQYLAETDMPMAAIQSLARQWVSQILAELPEQITRYKLRQAVKKQFMAAFTQEESK